MQDDSKTPATGGATELMATGEILRLFIINRMVDLGFMADIFVNFNLAYFDKAASLWVVKKPMIAKRYLKTWFVIDVVSILPFDSLGLVFESDSIQQLKILRIVRLLRLIKLLRVLRSSRVLARMQANSGPSPHALSLSLPQTLFRRGTLSLSHILGGWGSSVQQGTDPHRTPTSLASGRVHTDRSSAW